MNEDNDHSKIVYFIGSKALAEIESIGDKFFGGNWQILEGKFPPLRCLE